MPQDVGTRPGNGAAAPLRPLSRADLHWAADLHGRELADGFLSRLGARFLRQYLRTFLDTPGAVALAAPGAPGAVVGYVVGSTAPGHNRAALQRHWRRLLPSAIAALLLRPSLTWTFLRTRAARYVRVAAKVARRRSATGQDHAPGRRTAVLLHVAVEPRWRGRGLGADLVDGFVRAARAGGCTHAQLVSFGGPKDFYTRQGWQLLASRVDDDERTVVTYGRQL